MKRLFSAVIAVFLIFALVGCGQQEEAASGNEASFANSDGQGLAQEESRLDQTTREAAPEETATTYKQEETTPVSKQEETTKKQETKTNGHIYEDGILVTPIPDKLEFNSLEQFLEANKAVKKGNAAEDLTDMADKVGLTELEKLYVPKNIPEEYQLANLLIHEESIILWYVPKEYMDSPDPDALQYALSHDLHFQIGFARWDLDDPMVGIMKQENATEKDLIDGKYLFSRPNMLEWAMDRGVMIMYMPRKYCTSKKKIAEAVKFAEMTVIDLTQ